MSSPQRCVKYVSAIYLPILCIMIVAGDVPAMDAY